MYVYNASENCVERTLQKDWCAFKDLMLIP